MDIRTPIPNGINLDIIKSSVPLSLKKGNIERLGELILKKGITVGEQMVPKILSLVDRFQNDTCPSSKELNKIIDIRNKVTTQLNSVGSYLDTLSKSLSGISTFFDVQKTTITTLKTLNLTLNQAAKFIPLIPGGAVSAINDITTLTDNLTFDLLGSSKLKPIKDGLDASDIYIALTTDYINKAVKVLDSLDLLIVECIRENPTSLTILPISPNIISISGEVDKIIDEESLNNALYRGFTLNIQEEPFNSKLNRNVGVAINNSGVIVLKTDPSFTNNPSILIEELKFIIDRDNLKAY